MSAHCQSEQDALNGLCDLLHVNHITTSSAFGDSYNEP
jgi:hypothetical protein